MTIACLWIDTSVSTCIPPILSLSPIAHFIKGDSRELSPNSLDYMAFFKLAKPVFVYLVDVKQHNIEYLLG